ncbi:unnamed protein product [Urochloa humidicola]
MELGGSGAGDLLERDAAAGAAPPTAPPPSTERGATVLGAPAPQPPTLGWLDEASPAANSPPRASPPLSPAAAPFYPASTGRSMEERWLEDCDDEEECVDYGFTPSPRPSYRDVVRGVSPIPPPTVCAEPATHVATVPAATGGKEEPDATGRRRRRRRRHRRSRRARTWRPPPPPQVVPASGAGVRRPFQSWLGPRVPPVALPGDGHTAGSHRRPKVDADGFEEVMSRSYRRRLQRFEAPPDRSSAPSSSRRIPPELRDRCLNCLSYSHRVATCRLPPRCLRCHKFRHLAKDCRYPRPRPLLAVGSGQQELPRRFHVRSAGPNLSAFPRRDGRSTGGGGGSRGHGRSCVGVVRASDPPATNVLQMVGKAPLEMGPATSKILAVWGTSLAGSPVTTPLSQPEREDVVSFELQNRCADWASHDHHHQDPMLLEASLWVKEASAVILDGKASHDHHHQDLVTTPDGIQLTPAEEVLEQPGLRGLEPEGTPLSTQASPPVEFNSSDDGPELPPGFESGFEATNTKAAHLAASLSPIVEPASTETIATVVVSEVDHSAALEAFIANVSKDIPAPLADKPLRRRRVDPALVDAPPQLPSFEVCGIRRSYRQALDPLSAVKPAKRGEVLLMHRLGEVGVPLPSSSPAGHAVKQFFDEGPPPHCRDALLDMFPMLKNKSKTSPFMGLSVD